MPTRGPTSIFSGSGPSNSSKPPVHTIKLYQRYIMFNFELERNAGEKDLPGVKRGWFDHSVEIPSA